MGELHGEAWWWKGADKVHRVETAHLKRYTQKLSNTNLEVVDQVHRGEEICEYCLANA